MQIFQIRSDLKSVFDDQFLLDWYRIYLPDPQQVERNLEWIPPDEYYQTNSFLTGNSSNWNNELENSKEYLTRSSLL